MEKEKIKDTMPEWQKILIRELLTIPQAAKVMGVSKDFIFMLHKTGKLGYVKLLGQTRIPKHEITLWISQNTVRGNIITDKKNKAA